MRQKIAAIVAVCLLISSCSVQNIKPETFVPTQDVVKVDTHIDFIIDQPKIDWYIPPVINANDLNCMAKGIYYEAGGESTKGKEAVAFVIMNRMRSGKFPTTACGVVKQTTVAGAKRACQFSWYCAGGDSKINATISNERYTECMQVALSVLNGRVDNWIPKAISFHMSGVHTDWTQHGMTKVATVGNHIFYGYREKI